VAEAVVVEVEMTEGVEAGDVLLAEVEAEAEATNKEGAEEGEPRQGTIPLMIGITYPMTRGPKS
jgi:hypothetical protein